MNISSITVRYARAIYQAASEEKVIDEVNDDITALSAIIKESPEFSSVINSPTLKISQKKDILEVLFKGKMTDLTLNFLVLLVENKREMYIEDICRNFHDQYKKDQGIKEAVFTTTYKLDDASRAQVEKKIANIFSSKIKLNEKVDEDIIGGFTLKVDDQLVDASIASQLIKIKRELINS